MDAHPNPPPDIIKIPDDEKEYPCIPILCRGSESRDPISVEDYVDELLLQRTISASIAHPNPIPIIIDDYTEEVLLQYTIAKDISFSDGVIHLDSDEKENPEDHKKPVIRYQRRSGRSPLKVVFKGHSSTEIGECSKRPHSDADTITDIDLDPVAAATIISPTALCAICMDLKLLSQCFGMKGCGHLFCTECTSLYVASKIQENVTVITCPQPGCKNGFLEPEMCRSILPPEVFDRWGDALCESQIVGLMRFYCPYKDCSAMLIDETSSSGSEVIRESECPHCYRLFCAQCKVPWHTGATCKEFQKLGTDERQREDIMLMNMARKNKWQRCPKCRFYVERSDGCMFMRCRCGHSFCYGCSSPMTVDHYCQKCRR